ncbi:MAG: two-component regulator propeller domain-containing protein [Bryobacteraceae bacterium]
MYRVDPSTLRPAQAEIGLIRRHGDDAIIEALLEDREGSLWIATRTYLYRWTRERRAEIVAGFDHVTEMMEDSRGLLWLGTFNGGVQLFDPRKGKLRLLRTVLTDNARPMPVFGLLENSERPDGAFQSHPLELGSAAANLQSPTWNRSQNFANPSAHPRATLNSAKNREGAANQYPGSRFRDSGRRHRFEGNVVQARICSHWPACNRNEHQIEMRGSSRRSRKIERPEIPDAIGNKPELTEHDFVCRILHSCTPQFHTPGAGRRQGETGGSVIPVYPGG